MLKSPVHSGGLRARMVLQSMLQRAQFPERSQERIVTPGLRVHAPGRLEIQNRLINRFRGVDLPQMLERAENVLVGLARGIQGGEPALLLLNLQVAFDLPSDSVQPVQVLRLGDGLPQSEHSHGGTPDCGHGQGRKRRGGQPTSHLSLDFRNA